MIRPLQLLTFLRQNTQSLTALVLRGAGIAVLLGISLFITNVFEPQYVGEYELVRSLLLIGGSLVLTGFDQAILHYSGVMRAKNRLQALQLIYRKMVRLLLLVSVLIFALLLVVPDTVYIYLFEDLHAGQMILFTGAGLFFYALSALNAELFRAYGMINYSELFRGLIKYGLFLLVLIPLYCYEAGAYIYQAFLVSFVFLAMLSSLFIIKQKKDSPAVEAPKNIEIIKQSFPMAVSSLGFFLLLSIDIILLKKYSNYSQVAFYATAVKLVLIVSTVLNTVNALFATQLAHLYELGDLRGLQVLVKRAARLIFVLSLIPLMVIFIFPESILAFFGENYIQASKALVILGVGYLISTITGVAAIYLNMTSRAHIFQYILLTAVVINLLLNLILIPAYGIEGAATASGVAIAFWNLAVIIYVGIKDKIRLVIH